MVQCVVTQIERKEQLGDNWHPAQIDRIKKLVHMPHRLAVAAIVMGDHVPHIVQTQREHGDRVDQRNPLRRNPTGQGKTDQSRRT